MNEASNDYRSRLLKLFVPIMISNLISQIQGLIDRIFLGRIDVIYMSAVSNALAPVWTTMSLVFSLSIGSSILISQSVGAGKIEKAREYAASLMVWHNILPVVLFIFWTFFSRPVYLMMGVSENVIGLCVTYTRYFAPIFILTGIEVTGVVILQTSNNTKPLVWYGIIRSGLNVLLDYLLIFGKWGFPKMGIAGAALATTLAEFLGLAYVLVMIIKDKNLLTMPGRKEILNADIKPYAKSLKLGVNSALEEFAWNFGNLMIIRILNTINENAAGIYTIAFAMEGIVFSIVGAIGNGTVTLTGEATGSKDLKTYKSITKTAMLWSVLASALSLALCVIFPEQILSMFTTDETIITTSSIYLVLVGINFFSKSGNVIWGNAIRGYGDTKWMFYTQICGTVIVIINAYLFVKVFKVGMIGVFFAVLLDEFLRAIVNRIRYGKIKF